MRRAYANDPIFSSRLACRTPSGRHPIMPIADPFEHRATRNARQPALRLCFEACPLIYDPLHYLDFKSPEVGTEEVSRGFPHGDLWGTIVENGTKLLAGQTRCLISTKRLSRIAEDQREEAIPGHSVQLRLCWHEFAELVVGIRHPSRSPIEKSLFLPRHRGQDCALPKQRQEKIVRFRCGSPRTQPQSAFHKWFWQKHTAACLNPMRFRSSHRSTTCPVQYADLAQRL